MNAAVSIVIPVHNCGEMLIRCLESIQQQSFREFEVLIVNNGSTDGSDKIAAAFSEKDERFCLLDHPEGGAGSARNFGVSKASGEYIAFVDGDDRLTKNYIGELYTAAKANDADIALCGFRYYFLNTGRESRGVSMSDKVYSGEEALSLLLHDSKIKFYLWGRLFRRSLFTEHEIRIPDMYYEDAVITPQLFYYANKAVSVSGCCYLYTRAFSKYAEINMSAQRANDYINTIPLIRLFLEEQGCCRQFQGRLMHHVFHVYFAMPSIVRQCTKGNRNEDRQNLKNARTKIRLCLRCSAQKLRLLDLQKPVVK